MVRRGVGFVLRWAGIVAFCIGLLISIPILLEGITGLVGEGERLKRETPEQIRQRLIFVGELWGAAIFGWVAARVGTALREPNSRPPVRVAQLASEVLLLLGGLGIAAGVLTAISPRAATYETPDLYRWATRIAAVGGLFLLAAGWGVRRVWGQPPTRS
jgi:cytochrome bd-type quinol oxidase subunit 1